MPLSQDLSRGDSAIYKKLAALELESGDGLDCQDFGETIKRRSGIALMKPFLLQHLVEATH